MEDRPLTIERTRMMNAPAASGVFWRLLRSPALVFVLWSAWLAFPYLFLGPFSYAKSHDNADSVLSLFLASGPGGHSGGSGYWSPQMACGADRLSALPIGDPFRGLFVILPGWLAYGLIMAAQRFVAGYFMYR